MIGFAAERLTELEVGAMTGAADGEKDPGRQAQRKGDRDRDGVDEDQEMVRGTISPKEGAPGRSHCRSRSFGRAELHSTNPIERLKDEIRRRTEAVGTSCKG